MQAGDGPGEGGRQGYRKSGEHRVYLCGAFGDQSAAVLASLDAAVTMTPDSTALDADGEPLSASASVPPTASSGWRCCARRTATTVSSPLTGASPATWHGVPKTAPRPNGTDGILRTGHDIFCDNNDAEPVLETDELWQADDEVSEIDIDAGTWFREIGTGVLAVLFQPVLYENPYPNLGRSPAVVASTDEVDAGYRDGRVQDQRLRARGGGARASEPGGRRLSIAFPAAMDTMEAHLEDVGGASGYAARGGGEGPSRARMPRAGRNPERRRSGTQLLSRTPLGALAALTSWRHERRRCPVCGSV